MRKVYVCEVWPELCLGHIQFHGGSYATDDEDIQAMIEGSHSYGVQIQSAEIEEPEESEKPEERETVSAPPPESAPRRGPGRPPNTARQGTTGTGDLR